MNKPYLIFLLIFVVKYSLSVAQVNITNNDMPNFNEIYIVKTKNNLTSPFNYNETGEDFIWDISDIDFSNDKHDTFVKVSSTPLLYNVFFSNPNDPDRKATIATPRNMSMLPPGITVKDVYFFYKESVDKFSEVGFGATVNDIPMPIKYNTLDVWYHFPITYGTVDTSLSSFSLNIPSYGYFGENKIRVNTVDGWGTLLTDIGSFPVIRIKSELYIEDTIYYESYSQGFKFNRTETQYKWLASQIGIPVLLINKAMNSTSIELFDSIYMYTANINSLATDEINFSVYPNPTQDFLNVNAIFTENTDISLYIADIFGNQLFEKQIKDVSGALIDRIDMKQLNLKPGVYILNLKTNKSNYSLKFVAS